MRKTAQFTALVLIMTPDQVNVSGVIMVSNYTLS